MATRRMIDKKISFSEQVADLPCEAQLIFTWGIPHADDLGLLPYSLRTLKAMIVPMFDMTLETFGNHVESIVKSGLWEVIEWEGENLYRIKKFSEHQTLKKDRKPITLAENINSWEEAESFGNQCLPSGKPREEKRREVKIREEKVRAVSTGILTPSEINKSFFSGGEWFTTIREQLLKLGVDENWLDQELKKFIAYWTEKNSTGKQMKWQQNKTFEVKLRIFTWLSRAGKWSKEAEKKVKTGFEL